MDNKTKRGSPDSKRIDMSDPDEVRNWTKALGVSKARLLAAVKAAGTSAAKVRVYLAAHRP